MFTSMSERGRTSRRKRSSVIPFRTNREDGDRLKQLIQTFIRSSGVLSADRTPCSRPLAVSHAHALMLLRECGRTGQRPTQQDLGKRLGIDKSNVARLCQRMERAGHLMQERSRTDGRARLLALTARGARVASEVERASRARYQRLCAAIPLADRDRVLSALAVLNDALSASAERSHPSRSKEEPRPPPRRSPTTTASRQGAAS
jgi:DNA-binding MarR family transcriptional regulator